MKSTSHDAVLHKARNAVKRLRLDCRIDRAEQGWKTELVKLFGQGTIQSVVLLAEELQGDILATIPGVAPEKDWVGFELSVVGDDTVFDEEKKK